MQSVRIATLIFFSLCFGWIESARAQISPAIAAAMRSPPSAAKLDICFPGNGAQLLAQAIADRLRM